MDDVRSGSGLGLNFGMWLGRLRLGSDPCLLRASVVCLFDFGCLILYRFEKFVGCFSTGLFTSEGEIGSDEIGFSVSIGRDDNFFLYSMMFSNNFLSMFLLAGN